MKVAKIFLTSVAALALTACNDMLENVETDASNQPFTLTVSTQPETRMGIDPNSTGKNVLIWDSNDKLYLLDVNGQKDPVTLTISNYSSTQATFVSQTGVPAGNYYVVNDAEDKNILTWNKIYYTQTNDATTSLNRSILKEEDDCSTVQLYSDVFNVSGSTASITLHHVYAKLVFNLQNYTGEQYCKIGIYSPKTGHILDRQIKYDIASGKIVIDKAPCSTTVHKLVWQRNNNYDASTMTSSYTTTAYIPETDLSADGEVYFFLYSTNYDMQTNSYSYTIYEFPKSVSTTSFGWNGKFLPGQKYDITLDCSDAATKQYILNPSNITKKEDFRALAYCCDGIVNMNSESAPVQINSDIDFAGVDFFPVEGLNYQVAGNGKTLSNITINTPNYDNVGVFTDLWTKDYSNSTLQDRQYSSVSIDKLTLNNVTINGKNNVGAFLGQAFMSTMEPSTIKLNECALTGTNTIVGAGDNVGGIVGKFSYSCMNSYFTSDFSATTHYIKNCVVGDGTYTTSVQGTNNVGGICGSGSFKTELCIARANVTGSQYVGGIMGKLFDNTNASWNTYKNIYRCGFEGNVNANTDLAGGVLGGNSNFMHTQISECYSTGSVTCTSGKVGGIVGSQAKVDNCYSLATVNGTDAGGFEGYASLEMGCLYPSFDNCYFAGTITGSSTSGSAYGAIESGSMSSENPSVNNCVTTADLSWGTDATVDANSVLNATSIVSNINVLNTTYSCYDATSLWASPFATCPKLTWQGTFGANTTLPGYNNVTIP